MQRITTLMLSTLILAGMCLHASAQEAEIDVEVIELEPGIHLKKKIKKGIKSHLLRLKNKKGAHEVILRGLGGNDNKAHGNQVIELDNGSHAIIRIETDDNDGDNEVFMDLEEMPEGMGDLGSMLSQLNMGGAQGMAPLAALLGNMEGGEWQSLAGEAMKHLAKVKIELDGERLPLMNLMSPEGGLNFALLEDADDIHVQYGKHGMHFPMKAGRNLYKMFSQARKGGCCCDCNCGNKKSKKSHGSFSFAPHKQTDTFAFFDGQHGLHQGAHKGHLKQLKNHLKGKGNKNHAFTWSSKAPKGKSRVWAMGVPKGKSGVWAMGAPKGKSHTWSLGQSTKKSCPNCQQQSKSSNKADFYFKKAPKKHGAKRRAGGQFPPKMHKKHLPKMGSLFSSKPHGGNHGKGHGGIMTLPSGNHKAALKGLLEKHKVLRSSKGKHIIRMMEEMEDDDEEHHHDHDEDGLEEAIEDLEHQVQKLRKELRRLKKKI